MLMLVMVEVVLVLVQPTPPPKVFFFRDRNDVVFTSSRSEGIAPPMVS